MQPAEIVNAVIDQTPEQLPVPLGNADATSQRYRDGSRHAPHEPADQSGAEVGTVGR
jgi:hypothetical protein